MFSKRSLLNLDDCGWCRALGFSNCFVQYNTI